MGKYYFVTVYDSAYYCEIEAENLDEAKRKYDSGDYDPGDGYDLIDNNERLYKIFEPGENFYDSEYDEKLAD